MAERTTQSWTTAPHFFVTREVDASGMVALREKLAPAIEKSHGREGHAHRLMVALVARVLTKHPRINCQLHARGHSPSWRRQHRHRHGRRGRRGDGRDPEGEYAPASREIAVQRRDLTERARANRLRPADISGATFTISNLGMYQVDSFTAIIVPPQAAILAVGAITDRVVPVDGNIGIRPMISVTRLVRPPRGGRRARRGLPQRPRGSDPRAREIAELSERSRAIARELAAVSLRACLSRYPSPTKS